MTRGHAGPGPVPVLGQIQPGTAVGGSETPGRSGSYVQIESLGYTDQEAAQAIGSLHERLLRFQQRRLRSVVVTTPTSRAELVRQAILDAPELDMGIAVAA